MWGRQSCRQAGFQAGFSDTFDRMKPLLSIPASSAGRLGHHYTPARVPYPCHSRHE
jgi:hypothetical protein